MTYNRLMEHRQGSGDEEITEFTGITPERRNALNQAFENGDDLANPIKVKDFIEASVEDPPISKLDAETGG